ARSSQPCPYLISEATNFLCGPAPVIDLIDQPPHRSGFGKHYALTQRRTQHWQRLGVLLAQRLAQLAPDQTAHDAAVHDERRLEPGFEDPRLIDQRHDLAAGPDIEGRWLYGDQYQVCGEDRRASQRGHTWWSV